MAWEYETFGPDGQCELFGVNIFDYDWQTTGKRVKVKDPIYHQDHTFEDLAGRDRRTDPPLCRRRVLQLRVGILSGKELMRGA